MIAPGERLQIDQYSMSFYGDFVSNRRIALNIDGERREWQCWMRLTIDGGGVTLRLGGVPGFAWLGMKRDLISQSYTTHVDQLLVVRAN